MKVKVPAVAIKLASKGKFFYRKVISPKAPEILLIGGVACIVGGAVAACVKTKKVVEEYDDASLGQVMDILQSKDEALVKMENDPIEDEDGDEMLIGALTEEGVKELNRRKVKCGIFAARHYVIPASVLITGIGLIVASHNIQHARFVAVSAAYDSLLTVYTKYRERVIEEHGEDADRRYLYGESDMIVQETKTNKNGKERTVEKTIKVLAHDGQSMMNRCFDEYNTKEAERSFVYNMDFLKMQERVANQKFQAEGFLFLDEVYRALGFKVEEYPQCKLVGWIRETGDEKVSFGIYPDPNRGENESGVWLNFNCDGVIVDKL